MRRLTVWQKVGIVLSVVWAVGAAIYQHNEDVDRAESFAAFAYKACADSKDLHHDTDLSKCEQEKADHIAVWMESDVGNAAFLALAPLPFAWIAAYVLGGLGRALAIGLPVVLPWREMSWPKRVFVVTGVLTSEAFLWPAGVRKLVILGDNDASFTGHKAAYTLAPRCGSD